jgi:hypothetical protein
MPRDYPDFPSHRQILAYFQAYAEHFGVIPYVRLSTRVEQARREADGRWRLTLSGSDGAKEDVVDALFVCSGHHSDPVMPELPGHFTGALLHAHDYKRAEPFRGKRVLVIGGGNSACDIAVETARVSAFTAISMRRGYRILPKLMLGLPADIVLWRIGLIPKFIRQRLAGWFVHLIIGPARRYGLAKPEGRMLEVHPTLNTEILDALRHGRVHPRPAIEHVEGSNVRFADGREEAFDVIVAATGYRISFPFLAEPFSEWTSAEAPPLYLRMMPADIDDLYFIGLFQPIGCIWNLADQQARIAALQLTGSLKRPSDIAARIARERQHPHWHFQKSARHAVEVDFREFRAALLKEIGNSDAERLSA